MANPRRVYFPGVRPLVRGRFFESVAQLEAATAGWVCWWNRQRLHSALGYRAPQEVVDGALVVL
ncbi:integrase core domain-containing protein [Rothia nasimurium]|uniref:integrase core domain-containing protein n=1 Tax=Rothia nasimurium TaxID=85336 RepID=UPI003C6DB838